MSHDSLRNKALVQFPDGKMLLLCEVSCSNVTGWDGKRCWDGIVVHPDDSLFFTKETLKQKQNDYVTYRNASLDYICDGDRNWTFDDEGDWCSNCNQWFRYDHYGAAGYSRFFTGAGYRLCNNCVKEDNEDYFNSLIDAFDHANTIFEDKELNELGWEKVNKEHWANGLYGQLDNPKKILQKAKSEDANAQYIFSIVKNYNPYETEFDLWKRRAV